MTVQSQGTVTPRTQTIIAPEVSGRVISVSPAVTAGGFFRKGDVLITLDPVDFHLAVTQAKLEVARAKLRLAQEEAEAEVALREWKELGQGEGTPLSLRQPQRAEAKAAVAASESALERTQRDLDRTELRAPFDGRVRSESVDVGQFLSKGAAVARVYAIDYAEVRLPLDDRELEFLDLPLAYREDDDNIGPDVTLQAHFAGKARRWSGTVVRTEGEIDPKTRMVNVVARVADPYGRNNESGRPPLAVGLFVEAQIQGRTLKNVIVLPRRAFRESKTVIIIDSENRLRFRNVDVLRVDGETAYVKSGLRSGERVCLTALATVVDGMKVRPIGEVDKVVDVSPPGTSR